MNKNKPIMKEKTRREREMVSADMNTEGRTLTMHEGYEDGKKYLVPDANLEAMKQLVEYKMGGQVNDKYIQDYDGTSKKAKQDRFKKKLDRMDSDLDDEDENQKGFEKFFVTTVKFADTIKSSDSDINSQESKTSVFSSEGETTSKSEANIKRTEEFDVRKKSDDGSKTSVTESEDKRKQGQMTREANISRTEKFDVSQKTDDRSKTSLTQSEEKSKLREMRNESKHLRFLLSGHLRNDFKPIFIIHQYTGQPLFGEKVPDFLTTKKEGDIELFVSGKFYRDRILEEISGFPKSLLIKPQKILIDEKSKIYEDSIHQLLKVGNVGVEFEGKFLKQVDTLKYTPHLAFSVYKRPTLKQNPTSSSDKNPSKSRKKQTVYYVHKQTTENMFDPGQQSPGNNKKRNKHKRKKYVKEKNLTVKTLQPCTANPDSNNSIIGRSLNWFGTKTEGALRLLNSIISSRINK